MKTFDVALDICSSVDQKSFVFLNTLKDTQIQINISLFIDGSPLDLAETAVKIVMGDEFGEIYTQSCVITDEKNGKCNVILDSVLFFETGEYYAEIHLSSGAILDTTSAFYFYVVSSIYV